MKRIMFVFPVLLLVCAGMVMTGCTSDPSDPPPPIDNPDFVLKGGKFQYVFNTPRIEDGEEYEVIFTINDCDETLIGSHLGGKICYKEDMTGEDEKVLSGWSNSTPNTVSKSVKTYRWTFKAGEKYNDDVIPVSPATTPQGATQYFSLTAQDEDWHDYDSTVNFNIKGGFEVKVKGSAGSSEGEVTLDNVEGTVGKGELTASDMAKIRALPAGSEIELTINVTVSDSPAPGWGVGSIGTWVSEDSLEIAIPNNAPNGDYTFKVRFVITDVLDIVGNGNIAINLWNGATCTKAELFKSKSLVSAGDVTLGNVDDTAGKGNLSDADMVKIRALPAGSVIELTINVTVVTDESTNARPGWGVGQIGTWTDNEGLEIAIPSNASAGNQTFKVRFEIATILEFVPTGNIAINIWNGATCTKAELFKPED